MKIHYGIAAAAVVLTGLAVGAVTSDGLRAQAKPPAYVIIDISETMDAAAYIKAVSAAEPNATTTAGGRFIIRTTAPVSLDGAAPNRFIVIAFDSVEKAKAWNNTPAIKEVNAVRLKTTKSRAFVVEGLPN